MFTVNSPFTTLGVNLFTPEMTGQKQANEVGGVASQYDPRNYGKGVYNANRGMQQNPFNSLASAGAGAAARSVAQLSVPLEDAVRNAQWQLGVQSANEAAGLAGLGVLGARYGQNQSVLSRLLNQFL